ncbi:hypothetical protein [Tenacibaculum piscium]|uniref:hypothetical protein n=1 Tax=Tenacibaculum piscium TaxID=1458515 RepID=UPI001F2E104B|nr:hypothetical protein [Tenacibaculum piscium]
MKNLQLIVLLMPFLSIAQIRQGEIFKSFPTNPTENINLIGIIEVTKTMYGVTFEDPTISEKYKNAVKIFFKKRLYNYTDLKKYRLNIKKHNDILYIENTEIFF